jgi:hypothetical protein
MKVICIDDTARFHKLRNGAVYGVIRIDRGYYQLAETGSKAFWFTSRLRPIAPRKTDISIFTRMLKTAETVQ